MGSDGQRAATGGHANSAATVDRTMRAIVQDTYGSADVLRLARIGPPKIADNEVLVRVRAAGLDRGTWHLMTGQPYLLRLVFGIRGPKNPVPGRDVAGTVVAVGPAVTKFSAGDEVFGIGASGGVGSYAVQLAKAFGAHVTGVCGTTKLDLVRSLGADQVIDYTKDDFADGAQHYDLILDIAGNPSLSRLRRALTPTGTAVIVGGEEGGKWTGGMIERQVVALTLSRFVHQRLTSVLGRERGSDLERLAELIAAGKVTPRIDRTYPLDRVPEAMRHLEAGKARGKVAITID
jgi:NADPH:quinone reductase-like Zn-dependent oxidoreductase